MRATRQYNLIQQTYSIDQYLHRLAGRDVAEDELLYRACQQAWEMEQDPGMPSSLDVAMLLSELGTDETTLIVALLSTSRMIEALDKKALEDVYGEKITRLVYNVCQLHSIQSHQQNKETPEQAERLRRMLLSMVEDVRVVLIKLAFRVQRLRQLGDVDMDTRFDIAQELSLIHI